MLSCLGRAPRTNAIITARNTLDHHHQQLKNNLILVKNLTTGWSEVYMPENSSALLRILDVMPTPLPVPTLYATLPPILPPLVAD